MNESLWRGKYRLKPAKDNLRCHFLQLLSCRPAVRGALTVKYASAFNSLCLIFLSQSDKDDCDQELLSLRRKVTELPSEELDREVAEASMEIEFLEAQMKMESALFSPEDLKRATSKVLHYKRRAEIFKVELGKRNQPALGRK